MFREPPQVPQPPARELHQLALRGQVAPEGVR